MVEAQASNLSGTRLTRLQSHALVEVRRKKWWPLGIKSAVLLDINHAGFKIEFTGNEVCAPGDVYWMEIPLSPFGISVPSKIQLKISVKWFDQKKMRIGGVFENVDSNSKIYLEKIIEIVKDQTLGP